MSLTAPRREPGSARVGGHQADRIDPVEHGKIAIEQHSDVLWTQWLWTYFTGQRGSRLIPEDPLSG
jgi:hypothetical protein